MPRAVPLLFLHIDLSAELFLQLLAYLGGAFVLVLAVSVAGRDPEFHAGPGELVGQFRRRLAELGGECTP